MSCKGMGRKKGWKAKLLCLLTVLTVTVASMPMTAMGLTQEEADQKRAELDQKIASLQSQYNAALQNEEDAQGQIAIIEESVRALEEQQKVINEQIAGLDQTIGEYDGQIAQIDGQLQTLDEKIQTTQQEIDGLNASITQLQESLAAKEAEVDNTYEVFMQRMRAIYMNGEISSLTMFLNSDSFAEFLYQAEVKQRLAEQDKQLVDTLRTQINEMNATKTEIETSKQTLADKMNELEAARQEQQDKRSQVQQLRDAVQADKDAQMQAKQDLDENMEQLEAVRSEQQAKMEYAQRLQSNAQQGISDAQNEKDSIQVTDQDKGQNPVTPVIPPDNSDPSALSFTWPVPGYDRASNISSPYGNRILFGKLEFHSGIDIAGYGDYGHIAGKTIVAAEGGVVTIAKNDGGWNYGWGNDVSIGPGTNSTDGKHYETFYGHTQTVLVSVGQYVTKGTPIALVGTSGNSTGYHLHFEVRANSQYQNPLNYVHTR